jgi:hypothetical protein
MAILLTVMNIHTEPSRLEDSAESILFMACLWLVLETGQIRAMGKTKPMDACIRYGSSGRDSTAVSVEKLVFVYTVPRDSATLEQRRSCSQGKSPMNNV